MQRFKASGNGVFGYRVDFSGLHYANLSFFDEDRRDILFHLSLRHPEQLAVVNARIGGAWQAERPRETPLATAGDGVEIRFEAPGVRVLLNDEEVFAFAEDFPDIDRIAHVNFQGGLVPASIAIGGMQNAPRETFGVLEFTRPLELEGWAADPALARQDPGIAVEGLEGPIRVEITARPAIAKRHGTASPMIGVSAALPGRVWQAAGADGALRLQAVNNGLPCGAPLTLDRAGLAAQIDALAAASEPEAQMQDLLLAIEHLRFSGVWPDLQPATREVLQQAARTYGVTGYLGEGVPAEAPPPVAKPGPDQLLLRRARRAFAVALQAPETPDPLTALSGVIDRYALSPPLQRQLVLVCAETFCLSDTFPALYRFAAAADMHRFSRGDSAWHNSAILPFLLMQGRFGEVRSILYKLTEEQGWVSTPSIAWIAQETVRRPPKPEAEKVAEDILSAFMAFVERQNRSYWGRSPCSALIEASVALFRARGVLAHYMAPEVERFVLRVYGLSPRFWNRLGPVADLQSPALAGAAEAFGRIRSDLQAGKMPADADLGVFDRVGNPETRRYRLELFGPTGSRDLLEPDQQAANLGLDGADGAEAALRLLAFPGKEPRTSAALAPLARRAVRDRYKDVPRAPFGNLQGGLTRDCAGFLRDLAAGLGSDAAEACLVSLLDRMVRLSSVRSRFLGIGMMLSLLDGLLRQDREDLSAHVLARVDTIRGDLPKDHQVGLFRAPALRSALMSLSQMARGGDDGLAAAALALFPNFRPAQEMPVTPAADRWPHASPLFNTIVTVISCRGNLDTRVRAMRSAWLETLGDLGIPHVVVTGGGDGTLDEDILALDVADDYEGLPQKILATVQWVHDNTPFGHMLKIDDDCFLDAEAFFHALNYRKHDYYGRRLYRDIGQTDRVWHTGKAHSARGRLELDRSPEPSEYADGGSGYTLSRHAMAELLGAARTPAGRRLINSSFMEDKTVGDLLASRDIRVANEDYRVAIRRRSHPDARAVPAWLNSFHPSAASGVQMVHLDTAGDMEAAAEHRSRHALFPKKLWPTFAPASLGYQSGALELVSDTEDLTRLNAEPLAVVGCLRNEMAMLPHFLAHYRKLGVKAFLMVDNLSDDGSLEYLLDQPDVAAFSSDTDYRRAHYGVAWQMAVIGNLRVGRWSLMADIDELLVYRGWRRTPLPRRLEERALAEADAVRVGMLDMYPKGPLGAATFESGDPFAEAGYVDAEPFLTTHAGRGPFSDAPTVTSALRHRLLKGTRPELFVAQKYALLKYRPWMRVSDGLHYVAEARLAEEEMLFAHFKYTAAFHEKAVAEVARGQHFNDAEEYRRYLDLVAEGREVIFDPAISVPWQDCAAVRHVLG